MQKAEHTRFFRLLMAKGSFCALTGRAAFVFRGHVHFYSNFTTLLPCLYDTRPCPRLYSLLLDLLLVGNGDFASEVCEKKPSTACPTQRPPRGHRAITPTGHELVGAWACTPRFARERQQRDAEVLRLRRGMALAREH